MFRHPTHKIVGHTRVKRPRPVRHDVYVIVFHRRNTMRLSRTTAILSTLPSFSAPFCHSEHFTCHSEQSEESRPQEGGHAGVGMLRCAQHDNRAPASFRFLVAAMKSRLAGLHRRPFGRNLSRQRRDHFLGIDFLVADKLCELRRRLMNQFVHKLCRPVLLKLFRQRPKILGFLLVKSS